MNLRTRFSLSFAAILAVTAATAAFAAWGISQAATGVRRLEAELLPQVALASTLSREGYEARVASRGYALSAEPAYLAEALQHLDALDHTLTGARASAADGTGNPAFAILLDACAGSVAQYRDLIAQTTRAHARLGAAQQAAAAALAEAAAGGAAPERERAPGLTTLMAELDRSSRDARGALFEFEVKGDPALIQQAAARLGASAAALREGLRDPAQAPEAAIVAAMAAAPRGLGAMEETVAAWKDLQAIHASRVASGGRLVDAIARVTGFGLDSITQIASREGDLFRSVSRSLMTGVAVAMLVGFGLVWFLNRQVLGEVTRLVQAAETMAWQEAEGGAGASAAFWTFARRLGDDEMGRIGKSLIHTIERLAVMRRAIDASNQGIVITDPTQPENPIIYVNSRFERLTGYPAPEAIGRSGRFLLGPDHDQPGLDALREAIRSGREHAMVLRNARKDGSVFWSELKTAPVHNRDGKLTHFIAIIADVSAQREAQEALAESENRYRALVELSPLGIVIQQDGLVVFCNQALAAILGIPDAQALVGRPILDLVHPDYHTMKNERLRMLADHRVAVPPTDELFLRGDGTTIDVEVSACPFPHHGRDAALMVVRDISQRKAAERQLSVAFAENELLVSTISSVLIVVGTDERISRWNAAAERAFGLPTAQVVGKALGESGIDWDWGDFYVAMNRCLSTGKPVDLHDMRFRRADGSDGFLDVNIVSSWAATGDGSEDLGMIIMATDATERKLAEAQRNQGLKLESIGQLAAGIAHEINTPIQFIGDNLRFLGDSFGDLAKVLEVDRRLVEAARAGGGDAARVADEAGAVARAVDLDYLSEEVPKAISQSLEGVDRVAVIVRAMKEFSHPDQAGKKPTDLNKALTTTLTVARNEYKYVADLVTALDEQLPLVPCFAGEMNQVFLNLIVNAAHAIGDVVKNRGKGTITVTTRRDGDFAELRFSDTGTGVPEAVRAKIFDPFFTTKGVGKGTGQGLYLSRTIVVKKHGGTIHFETEMGKGTTFIIRLPLTAGTT